MFRTKAINRARSYSKRHNCTMYVEHVVKGRGKGQYEPSEDGLCIGWWESSVVEIIATYKNGKRI